ncbi:hypothetical protein ACLIBH_05770 [Virgibacillus sp. W0430]|uniref:hypothetical protein n=1 Tax=Virgibacillus sp. W0430 TaxID=3391580 RepID=UPI003F4671C2
MGIELVESALIRFLKLGNPTASTSFTRVNQTTVLARAMVLIASMVGVKGLGEKVLVSK